MKKLEIITGKDNPILRKKSVEVKKFDSGLKKLVKGMKVAMAEANGLGLAAPQVAENVRVILITLNYKGANEMVMAMVNPVILAASEEMELDEEGCLSLPGIYAKVWRHAAIRVQFQDVDGGRHVLELDGLNAREVQHELDHLDGVLFVDRVDEAEEVAVL